MHVDILLGIGGFVLSAVIVWNGWKDSLARQFPFFYLYVLVSTLGALALWVCHFLDMQHGEYIHVYFPVQILRQGLEICILAKVYSRFRVHDDHRMWQVLTFLTLVMAAILWGNLTPGVLWQSAAFNPFDPFAAYQFATASLLQFQTLFCALTLGHIALNRRLTIGWNQFTIISGLAISILFKYIGWALLASGVIVYDRLMPWIMPIDIVPWIIWAISMRGQSPTRELPEARAAELEAQRRECEKAVRSLLQR